jgi:hypothetical protein
MTEVRLITRSCDTLESLERIVLNPVREIRIVFIAAQTLKWQNRDALFGRICCDWSLMKK